MAVSGELGQSRSGRVGVGAQDVTYRHSARDERPYRGISSIRAGTEHQERAEQHNGQGPRGMPDGPGASVQRMPMRMVGKGGLEPPQANRLLDPESSASTNSATFPSRAYPRESQHTFKASSGDGQEPITDGALRVV